MTRTEAVGFFDEMHKIATKAGFLGKMLKKSPEEISAVAKKIEDKTRFRHEIEKGTMFDLRGYVPHGPSYRAKKMGDVVSEDLRRHVNIKSNWT